MSPTDPIILYQDNHLIAVYKPAGLLTQGDQSGEPNLLDEVKAWLGRTYNKPGNVFLGLLHRLDRPVAGVLLFARTSKAAARLSAQFRERSVEKRYWAYLEGTIDPPQGRLEHYLTGGGDAGPVRVFDRPRTDVKRASLEYATLANGRDACLVEIRLETGRKHQIRAQFAHVGHPIYGDRRYGARRAFAAQGIGLLAVELCFEHPIHKQPVRLQLPEALRPAPMQQLVKATEPSGR